MSTTKTREAWLASLKPLDKVALEGKYNGSSHEYSVATVERVTPTGRIWLTSGEQYRNDGTLIKKVTGRASWGEPSYKLVELTPEILQGIDTRIRKRNLRAQIETLLDNRAIDNLSVEGLEEVLTVLKKHMGEA